VARAVRTWRYLGWRSAVGLIVAGALVIAEAILSHIYRVGWTGEYGWHRVGAIVIGALAIVIGAIGIRQMWTGWPSEGAIASFGRRCAPFLLAAGVYFTAFVMMGPVPEGDQPHYELESLGLAYEQTRDMTIDYSDPERWRIMFPLGVPNTQAFVYKPGGELVTGHNVGLPLLLSLAVPWVEEAGVVAPYKELAPWNIEIIFLGALAALVLYRILSRLRPGRGVLVTGVWASVVFSAPMVVYASQIYPEMPAVLLALISVDALMRPPTRRTLALGAVAAALMPWFHVRFLIVAVFLVLALAFRALAALPPQQRRAAAGARSAAWAILPLLISQLVMGVAFQHWYGSPLPTAQYGIPQLRQSPSLSASWVSLAGGFWSGQRGWLPFAPVCILALGSIGYTLRRHRMWTLFGLLVVAAYLLGLTIEGTSIGFSFAARYQLILIPFAAIPLLIAAADLARVRWVFWPLALITLYLAAAIVLEPPPTISGVPGVTGPAYPQLLWPWFVELWPGVVPSAAHFYPDIGAVAGWSVALFALAVAGYFARPRPGASLGGVGAE